MLHFSPSTNTTTYIVRNHQSKLKYSDYHSWSMGKLVHINHHGLIQVFVMLEKSPYLGTVFAFVFQPYTLRTPYSHDESLELLKPSR
ncbi:hypothetical protein HanRHA438_Chr04g0157501 [Helianthus annuus]|nr:hypothetical protein HanRHA438_Chr04g0157501 [Helianthus annuus]